MVVVELLEFACVDACALLRLNVAPDDDALTRRQGQSIGRADRFAEAAFDALVDDLVGSRHWLEMFEVDLWVFAEHYVGIEDALRV